MLAEGCLGPGRRVQLALPWCCTFTLARAPGLRSVPGLLAPPCFAPAAAPLLGPGFSDPAHDWRNWEEARCRH